jgi:FkbM family methyltransferase
MMGKFPIAKQLSLSLGLYKQARVLRRALSSSERRNFRQHRSLLSQFVNAGALVFDVGANVGNKTEILLSLGARVVAFEPQPNCCREISVRGNKRLTVVNKAVGAVEGTADLYLNSTSAVASLVPNWRDESDGLGKLTVRTTTLDNAIAEFGVPEFCKIDVEGFEPEVMRGLSYPISAVTLEYHNRDNKDIHAMNECIDVMVDRFGKRKYMINLTGQEEALLLLSRWVPIEEFKNLFPSCARGNLWGDLFIRLA